MKSKKCPMHTPINILSFFVLLIVFAVAFYFIWKDAYNDTWRLIGILVVSVFFLYETYLFLVVFRVFDRLVFTKEGVERCSLVGKKLLYKYSELYAVIGVYTSMVEKKKYLILIPKSLNVIVNHIDTSSSGNLIPINRMNIVYCTADDEIIDFLTEQDCQWVDVV